MRTGVKTPLTILSALAFLAGCKGATGNDYRSPAASAEKPSPAPTEAEGRKTGYLHTGDDSATFIH